MERERVFAGMCSGRTMTYSQDRLNMGHPSVDHFVYRRPGTCRIHPVRHRTLVEYIPSYSGEGNRSGLRHAEQHTTPSHPPHFIREGLYAREVFRMDNDIGGSVQEGQ